MNVITRPLRALQEKMSRPSDMISERLEAINTLAELILENERRAKEAWRRDE